MRMTGNPLAGLVLLKLLALVLGIACWRTARLRLLDRVVLFYSVLVAYNLTCLLLGLIAQARP
jgi:F0F1-type ATP synthase membrane subunit a